MARSALLSIVLLTAMLAGCAGSQDPQDAGADDPMGDDMDGGAGLATLDATSSVPAPKWAVGQWWEWEVFFDEGAREDTFRSIVVSQSGGSSLLATEKAWASKEDAAFDQPVLGAASATDLSTEGWGGQLRLLSFPLTNGKTWSASMPNFAWDVLLPSETAEIAMTASFDDGGTILEATYLPATGWFGELVFHDIDPGQEAVEIGFRAKSAGLNYTGPYFMHEARLLLAVQDAIGFTDVPTEGGQPITQPPQPAHTFTMSEGKILFGLIVAEAVAGGRAVVLTPPQGESRHVEAVGAPEGGMAQFYDEPGMAGEWRVTTTGAGGFSGAFIELYEMTETTATL
jgi:hypothetical protein